MKRFQKSVLIISILTFICSSGLFAAPRPNSPAPRRESAPRPKQPAHRPHAPEHHKKPVRKYKRNHDHDYHHNSVDVVEFHFPLLGLIELLDDVDEDITICEAREEPIIISGGIVINVEL